MKLLAKGELKVLDMADDQIVDAATLSVIINDCFKITMDNTYNIGQQGAFYALGCSLRDQHKILVSRIFEANTAEIERANALINEVNSDLKVMLEKIEGIADTIEKLGALVSQLSSIIDLIPLV